MDFDAQVREKARQIEAVIRRFLPAETLYQKTVAEAVNYSVLAGGKRLRPMLMQETYRLFAGAEAAAGGMRSGADDSDISSASALGGMRPETAAGDGAPNGSFRGERLLAPFMAAMEMIHTYSLVHDDLPAMDNDEYRRGRKTTWVTYGEAMGILAGDALLNLAFETAGSALDAALDASELRRAAAAMNILSKKAGIDGMLGGQAVDVEMSGQAVREDVLQFIYRKKTGALIEAAMMIGAVLAGASKAQIEVTEKIAAGVGLAFQIEDDILDVTGSLDVLGKPAHSDEKNEKTTYVTLYGIEGARAAAEKISGEAVAMLGEIGGRGTFLEQLIRSLVYRKY